jgi:hypothetical protein
MAESGSEGEFRVTDRRRRAEGAEAAEAEPRRPPPPPETRAGGQPPPEARERSLDGLFVMLASSAMVALGEATDPATGQGGKDPGAASEAIELLILLREKTEGNRTPRETQLLEELIYDLQLRYVAALKPRL